ncbi:0c623dfe-873c-4570-8f9e-b50ea8616364 [Thermothielavioides terrestris]|uniref:0c623dfe-873c-4570-8f9e-b50ea8616364 n=1 Tax=Thermothielavioides terrestris TaxID=2587410 RepID=A0A446B7L5_9PEZI|nr:0c623dfe-873c-4570-8f9e-b50ea8616364 [Thermothielavioides terrestris]
MADARVPPRRKTTIEIPLPSVRKYVPGSGPPPPRISLAPPRDSTAYIIDQFVLPADKDTTEASRRLIYYHIGFTDLPAARLLIPCNKVLDYVSPRELEDWEYKNLERKEEEQARRRAEEQRACPQKKRPGRSTKVPMDDVGVPALSPADEALLLAQQVAGPSLSTPQKRRLGRMLDEEDVGDTSNADSDDAAIRRQLQAEAESEGVGFEDELGLESESESVDQLSLHYDTPADA